MKFIKKPIVIDAVLWDGTLSGAKAIQSDIPTLETRGMSSHPPSDTVTYWRIGTLEGGHEVSPGDWIITGIKGEHYPCKPEIFALTYDAV